MNASLDKSRRRMNKNEFVSNTYSLIEKIIQEKEDDLAALNKKWKPAIQSMLKEFYEKVKEHAIDLPNNSPTSDKPSGSPVSKATSNMSLHMKASASETFATSPVSNKSMNNDLDNSDPPSQTLGRSHREGSLMDSRKQKYTIYQGQMMRKHYIEKEQTRAKSRKWVSFWCTLLFNDETGLELSMWKTFDSTTNLVQLDSEDELSMKRSIEELNVSKGRNYAKVRSSSSRKCETNSWVEPRLFFHPSWLCETDA